MSIHFRTSSPIRSIISILCYALVECLLPGNYKRKQRFFASQAVRFFFCQPMQSSFAQPEEPPCSISTSMPLKRYPRRPSGADFGGAGPTIGIWSGQQRANHQAPKSMSAALYPKNHYSTSNTLRFRPCIMRPRHAQASGSAGRGGEHHACMIRHRRT